MTENSRFAAMMQQSVTFFAASLQASRPADAGTHKFLVVTGWNAPGAIKHLATYLVGLRLSLVDYSGRISCELLGSGAVEAAEITRSIAYIIDPPGDLGKSTHDDWKATWRNAWIAEGIWHCCLRVAMERKEVHSPGLVVALDFAHISPKDHGFDVLAVYVEDGGQLGVSFVETKAYRDNPNSAISDAISILKEVEEGRHDARIRQRMAGIRPALSAEVASKFAPGMWRERRTHIPNPHYEESGSTVAWKRKRSVFQGLASPVLVMPHAISGYAAFFDAVANEMQAVAKELATNV